MNISPDSKYLLVYMQNNTIKIVTLFNMKIINEISGIYPSSEIVKTTLFNKQNFLVFYSKEDGMINFYNISNNDFPFYLKIKNKNYTSQTENEQQNLRELKTIAFAYDNIGNNYMLSNEGFNIDYNKLNLSYFKFWKINKNSIELICLAENPHLNEKINYIQGGKNKFISNGEYSFKIWELNENKFICKFEGKYRHKKLSHSVLFPNKNFVFAVFENFLVKYSNSKIDKIYAFDPIYANMKVMCFNNSNLLCLYNNNHLIIFNAENWEISWSETLNKNNNSDCIIEKVIENNKEINVIIKNSMDSFLIIKYSLSELKTILDSVYLIRKRGISYIDLFKKYFMVINNKMDIFLAGNTEKTGEQTKKELDDMDIEVEPRKKLNK